MQQRYFERKRIRLKNYNYRQEGYYFITICTKNKNKFFGKITDGKIEYSNIGSLAIKGILEISNIYKEIKIDKYVVMPNHIHLVLIINENDGIDVSRIIKHYKEKITKALKYSIWQKSYFDHIIRNEKDYYRIWKYIDENIIKWELDMYYN